MASHAPLALLLSAALLVPPSVAQASTASFVQDASEMSDEEKIERAKTLFGEGDAAFQGGNFGVALAKFEEAYNVYAPDIHVFNINIGLAAYELKDCGKAKVAFQRFLDLVPDHPARGEAQQKLLELERTGCGAPPEDDPAPVTTPSDDESAFGGSGSGGYVASDDDDAPVLTSSSKERKSRAAAERRANDAKKKPLLIAGAVLTGVGVLALGGGGLSIALAAQKRNELQSLVGPSNTGFPGGVYNEDVFRLDRNQLPANNYTTIALFGLGGAMTVTGIALIAVHFAKKKKAGKADTGPAEAWRRRRAADRAAALTVDGLPRVMLAPSWTPTGGGAMARVRF